MGALPVKHFGGRIVEMRQATGSIKGHTGTLVPRKAQPFKGAVLQAVPQVTPVQKFIDKEPLRTRLSFHVQEVGADSL